MRGEEENRQITDEPNTQQPGKRKLDESEDVERPPQKAQQIGEPPEELSEEGDEDMNEEDSKELEGAVMEIMDNRELAKWIARREINEIERNGDENKYLDNIEQLWARSKTTHYGSVLTGESDQIVWQIRTEEGVRV